VVQSRSLESFKVDRLEGNLEVGWAASGTLQRLKNIKCFFESVFKDSAASRCKWYPICLNAKTISLRIPRAETPTVEFVCSRVLHTL
jgi:hypothetical protein